MLVSFALCSFPLSYAGILCSECADGYYKEGNRCADCADTGGQAIILAATAAVVCMSTVCIAVAAMKPDSLKNITEWTLLLQDVAFAAKVCGLALTFLSTTALKVPLTHSLTHKDSLTNRRLTRSIAAALTLVLKVLDYMAVFNFEFRVVQPGH